MKKYVLVGCGSRGVNAFALPIIKNYSDDAKLCGVYDINKKRAALPAKLSETDVPVFDDFDKMLSEVKPDTVIVAPKDCDHDFYITRALKVGCNVISEKPVTTDFDKANAIRQAVKESGKEVVVTFNLRFHPFFKRVKELLKEGVIGDIYSVHLEWMLDTSHGADYFRRWHRERKNSGSLLIHKSTHHFDLVNWFLEEEPEFVNAFGARRFYGPTRENRSERCLTCPHKKNCEFYLDITSGGYKTFYLDCESEDGYYRDRCVFSPDIDIEDTVSVNVSYSGGAMLSYTLTAYSPYESSYMVLNGSKGRMEISVSYSYENPKQTLKIYNRKGEEIIYNIPPDTTSDHGGADDKIRDMLIYGIENDILGQKADLKAGILSAGIGMAANISMAEGRRVAIKEYVPGL